MKRSKKKKNKKDTAGPIKPNVKSSRFYIILLGVLILAYITLFSGVAILKYDSFSFHDMDLASINQVFWNTTHGNFIRHYPGQPTILHGGHIFFIIFIITPLYAVFPSPITILILQSVALSLGTWAVYLLAHELLPRGFGIILAAVYITYPALNYVNLYEFHVIALATPLLLFMFYFYQRKKWGLFILFMSLALSCREDVTIPVFAIGVFALIRFFSTARTERKGELKYALVPLLASVFWIILCLKVIQPAFRPATTEVAEATSGTIGFYGWLGGSITEILSNIFRHPGMLIEGIFNKPKSLYLLHLSAPVSFLLILSPTGLLTVFLSLMEGLLSSRATHYSIKYQYSSLITPLIFVSTIYGLRNLLRLRWLTGKKHWLLLLLLVGPILSVWLFSPLPDLPDGINLWKATPEDRVRNQLVRMVPPLVPVIATFEFTPSLSMRSELYFFYHVYAASRHPGFDKNVIVAQQRCRYALIDFNDYLTFYDFYTPGGDRDVYRFLSEGNWILEQTVNSLCLFRKGERSEFGVISADRPGRDDQSLKVQITDQLELAGYRLREQTIAGATTLETDLYFTCSGRIPTDFLPMVRLFSLEHPDFFFQQEFFAPCRIYPTSRWRTGDRWKLSCNILIPPEAPAGPYRMEVGLLWPKGRSFTGKIIYQSNRAIYIKTED